MPKPEKPVNIIAQVESSGTGGPTPKLHPTACPASLMPQAMLLA
jgi:hypothetical protein